MKTCLGLLHNSVFNDDPIFGQIAAYCSQGSLQELSIASKSSFDKSRWLAPQVWSSVDMAHWPYLDRPPLALSRWWGRHDMPAHESERRAVLARRGVQIEAEMIRGSTAIAKELGMDWRYRDAIANTGVKMKKCSKPCGVSDQAAFVSWLFAVRSFLLPGSARPCN